MKFLMFIALCLCLLLIVAAGPPAQHKLAQRCGVDVGGTFLDFSSLTLGDDDGPGHYTAVENTPGSEYDYLFNVCGVAHNTPCSKADDTVAICQQAVRDKDSYIVARYLNDPAPVWTALPLDNPSKVIYSFHTGDECNSNNRTASIVFVCDVSTVMGEHVVIALSVVISSAVQF